MGSASIGLTFDLWDPMRTLQSRLVHPSCVAHPPQRSLQTVPANRFYLYRSSPTEHAHSLALKFREHRPSHVTPTEVDVNED